MGGAVVCEGVERVSTRLLRYHLILGHSLREWNVLKHVLHWVRFYFNAKLSKWGMGTDVWEVVERVSTRLLSHHLVLGHSLRA